MTSALPRLLAIGTALPEESMKSEDYAEFAVRMSARIPREAALIHALVRRSGIATRHSVLAKSDSGCMRLPFYEDRHDSLSRIPSTGERMVVYAREAPPLAMRAAREALEVAELKPSAITHLVTASCTGFTAPGIDYLVLNGLGLDAKTARTHIGFMGCHAAINALASARAICLANPNAVVLGVAVELCTLHFQPGLHRDDLLPNSLFADGAAAFILAGSAVAKRNANDWRLAETHSRIIPDTVSLMTWRIVDTGFRMTLDASVPDVIAQNLPTLTRELGWADSNNCAWAIHPGGPRILEAAARSIGLPEAKTAASLDVLSRFGNISSPTVLFILRKLLGQDTTGDTIRIMAFGPGLAVEAAAFGR